MVAVVTTSCQNHIYTTYGSNLRIGHALRTCYNHMPNFNLICQGIFKIMFGNCKLKFNMTINVITGSLRSP